MSDAINPQHYKSHPSGVEAIELCSFLDFSLGNALKYLWRAGKKPGQLQLRRDSDGTLEDLAKSRWYLDYALKMQTSGLSTRRVLLNVSVAPALTRVITSEPEGSVLRDVLDLVVAKMLNGDEPRIADALARVERAIEEVTRA